MSSTSANWRKIASFAVTACAFISELTNRKLLPLAWLEIEDSLADRLRISERDILPSGTPGVAVLRMTTAMRWYERVTWNLTVECPARGYFPIGPVQLRSADAFGFFQQRERISDIDYITVYPAIAPLERIIIPARHLFGDQRIKRPIITDPMRTVGIRDYRPEDSFRHIHWKATARTQSLQTKIFEPTTSIQFGIFLNLDTFERYWEGLDFRSRRGRDHHCCYYRFASDRSSAHGRDVRKWSRWRFRPGVARAAKP